MVLLMFFVYSEMVKELQRKSKMPFSPFFFLNSYDCRVEKNNKLLSVSLSVMTY